ncbi:MAG TPA: DUF2079 domain-containing protein [Candidatus Baltobacteraceae bacterium]|nr:DUF2079 domain-containing protein [Candidatus Baltobacteraceae bacterium]
MTLLYAVLFSVLGADRYATYHAGADLGLFAQTIATAFHGFHNTFEAGSHFAYHFSPILYLCAPPLWAAHSDVVLAIVQAVATSLVAPALYLIARRRTSDRNAAGLACIALLYPPLQGVTFTDFHEVAFAPAAIAWLLWALDSRRFVLAYVLLALALSIKEDQAPAMAFLGIAAIAYFAIRRERAGVVFGSVAIVGSVACFAGYFLLVRPLAGAPALWMPKHFYAWSGYAQALPLDRQIVGRLTYLLEAFLPLAFIPFRSRVMILSLPGFLEVLASREPLTYTMGQHYAAVWVPYVLVAFALAGARILSRADRKSIAWVRTSAALCVIVLVFFSPLHLGHFLRMPQPQDAATNALIGRIPPDAAIGTYDEIYAHLGFFPKAQVGLAGAPEYVLVDGRYASAAWNANSLPVLRRDVRAGFYVPVASDDGIILYRRKPPA